MSFFSKLGKILSVGAGVAAAPFTGGASLIPTIIGAAGSALGGVADASAANRGQKIDVGFTEEQLNQQRKRDYINQLMAREDDRRAGGNDAWKAAQQAQYVENAKGYTPRAGLKSYGFGPKAATEPEVKVAQDRFLEANRRLSNQDSLTPGVEAPSAYRVDPRLMEQSGFEKFANVAAPLLTGLGGIADAKQKTTDPLAALRNENPELTPEQLNVIAEVLQRQGIKF